MRHAALPVPIYASSESAASGSRPRLAYMPPTLRHILEEVQREIGLAAAKGDTPDRMTLISTVAERLGLELTRLERDEILTHVEKDDRPFGVLQELVDDQAVSDIIVTNFSKVAVQQGRRNFTTGISWPSQEAYEAFVERILQKAGATYSTKKPVTDGSIGGYARIHAVHRSICDSGPYLTIRLNRFSSVSTNDLVNKGLAPAAIMAYLASVLGGGNTLLIVGEVGTGKTTLARALASSIPESESILVIEDTPEIRLEHPHVRYVTTREANTDGAGRISPGQCIRAGMRMAMNRIIFGEIRDAEAAEAFIDVCASGHPGLSTIHARSAAEALARLELFLGRAQRGVSRDVITEQVASAVQVVVFVNICPETGARRIIEVREIGAAADGVVRQREMFRYQVHGSAPRWQMVTRVSTFRDLLESAPEPLKLAQLPAYLELSDTVQFAEGLRA